jgi:hypothetical protein
VVCLVAFVTSSKRNTGQACTTPTTATVRTSYALQAYMAVFPPDPLQLFPTLQTEVRAFEHLTDVIAPVKARRVAGGDRAGRSGRRPGGEKGRSGDSQVCAAWRSAELRSVACSVTTWEFRDY